MSGVICRQLSDQSLPSTAKQAIYPGAGFIVFRVHRAASSVSQAVLLSSAAVPGITETSN
jgi:hypothetical protein